MDAELPLCVPDLEDLTVGGPEANAVTTTLQGRNGDPAPVLENEDPDLAADLFPRVLALLKGLWMAMFGQAYEAEMIGAGRRVVEAGRRAAPYLLRAERWGEASQKRNQVNDWCADTFEAFDLLITPTVPYDPPPAKGSPGIEKQRYSPIFFGFWTKERTMASMTFRPTPSFGLRKPSSIGLLVFTLNMLAKLWAESPIM